MKPEKEEPKEVVMITLRIPLPETCGECPFYSETRWEEYREHGNKACCSMKYMRGDMRDKSFKKERYEGCRISEYVDTGE